jgi:predicted 3-demethylubiquinone-9 3-methyltransferase (glyoxalase superfamily)
VSIFEGSRLKRVLHYREGGQETHGKPPGSVMLVEFELGGQPFTALNGGPQFIFTEAISLVVTCQTQEEIDSLWDRLTDGGEEVACGWLKDRYGLSWQITPAVLGEMLADPDSQKVHRVTEAFLPMKKLVIADLERAFAGG